MYVQDCSGHTWGFGVGVAFELSSLGLASQQQVWRYTPAGLLPSFFLFGSWGRFPLDSWGCWDFLTPGHLESTARSWAHFSKDQAFLHDRTLCTPGLCITQGRQGILIPGRREACGASISLSRVSSSLGVSPHIIPTPFLSLRLSLSLSLSQSLSSFLCWDPVGLTFYNSLVHSQLSLTVSIPSPLWPLTST